MHRRGENCFSKPCSTVCPSPAFVLREGGRFVRWNRYYQSASATEELDAQAVVMRGSVATLPEIIEGQWSAESGFTPGAAITPKTPAPRMAALGSKAAAMCARPKESSGTQRRRAPGFQGRNGRRRQPRGEIYGYRDEQRQRTPVGLKGNEWSGESQCRQPVGAGRPVCRQIPEKALKRGPSETEAGRVTCRHRETLP
jgi:hypothetical protein